MIDLLGGPTPVVSTFDAFWSYKPYEVPGSDAHSPGAANKVKAEVLFDWFVDHPGLRGPLPR